ncbi:unnamed protein product [Thelazia callipaeda]|uniref:IRS-type PTB domain-containing protein n=1 Tax=Thelazia callipaeda TaxID=103827 RepID=A0A0N5D7M3_THECL|nr:unnamed protein product [Thelazia callipaeda]
MKSSSTTTIERDYMMKYRNSGDGNNSSQLLTSAKTIGQLKLDSETNAMIKLRYKDISKYVIWPDCTLPEEYNQSCLTLTSNFAKETTIRYSHAGNHQASLLGLRNSEAMDKRFTVIPFGSPKTFPRTKHHKSQPYCILYPARNSRSNNLATVEEEQQPKRALSLDHNSTKVNETVVDIEDDRTPIPKRVINSVRRSESSDDDEPIVSLTSPVTNDESGFIDVDYICEDEEESDVQIWRF